MSLNNRVLSYIVRFSITRQILAPGTFLSSYTTAEMTLHYLFFNCFTVTYWTDVHCVFPVDDSSQYNVIDDTGRVDYSLYDVINPATSTSLPVTRLARTSGLYILCAWLR